MGYVHDCQLEKTIACMALVRKKGRQKQKSCSYLVVNREKMFDLYIMYIFIGAKVNHTSSKNVG